ncbi:MAG: hypothetical protein Q9217_005296 [Psora testacea]
MPGRPPPSSKDDYPPANEESSRGDGPPEKKPKIEAEEARLEAKPPESDSTPKEETSTKVEHSSIHPTISKPSATSYEGPDTSISTPSIAPPPNALPPQLLALLQNIQSTLTTIFPHSPPYTAQRLSELLLQPKRHYRTLPSYLRAIDRVVSVASSLSDFPLPALPRAAGSMTENVNMINGNYSPEIGSGQEDKDFIGGAELTEIPWLRNTGSPTPVGGHGGPNASDLRTESTRVIDGPNGAGSVETVTVSVNGIPRTIHPFEAGEAAPQHGITQGELLRQEQEAGVVTVPSASPNGRVTRSTAAATAAASRAVGIPASSGENEAAGEDNAGEEEPVHARGPSIIGMEDMGPQAPGSGLEMGLDVEGALGRRGEREGLASAVGRPEEEEDTSDGANNGGVLANADGVLDGETGFNETGRERGADAVDSTTL